MTEIDSVNSWLIFFFFALFYLLFHIIIRRDEPGGLSAESAKHAKKQFDIKKLCDLCELCGDMAFDK